MFASIKRRRQRKDASETLRHVRHLRNVRGDLMSAPDLQCLLAAENALGAQLKRRGGADDELVARTEAAAEIAHRLSPRRSFASVRENIEVIVVAVAVAMGFRSYILQPFKIPTGSMEPTLFGIHALESEPTLTDRFPVKYVKWLLTGEMHHVVRTTTTGLLSEPQLAGSDDPTSVFYYVGPRRYRLPRNAILRFRPGENVAIGQVLWSGKITAGDHVFVNKMAWNFRLPARGEIMVFATHGILGLQDGTHYIKRMCGLPGETISIRPPDLLVNEVITRAPVGIARVASKAPGYAGYSLAQDPRAIITQTGDCIRLSDTEYLALGDNTFNSRDSRYWGPVPRQNLVGPATTIYWPLSRRWGLVR